ncbi:hypothetical protein RDI58_001931 [Solanum bulbocastanum]|uniref:Zinc finger PHD-type domain-containing protein n=1 Tax=Solanum bulbocastanum TaxID=147425 RepID=A0AAN8UEV5_SOLBU
MGRGKQTCQGKQHFSHPHILKPIVNPTETLTCNVCEQPNITSNFYGCNTCQYFLHENCLNTPRFLDHPSHSSHHLTLLPVPTYSNRSFTCKACGTAGTSCSFSCACCDFDIHMQCALLPQTVVLPQQHHHELELIFESPCDDDTDENTVFVCDVCHNNADLNNWLYYCADCDFGTHLECANSKSVRQQEPKKPQVNKPRGNRVIIRKTEEEPIKIQETNQKEEVEDEDKEEDGGVTNEVKKMKHFSHSHALELSVVQETEDIICSGCEDKLCGTAYKCTKRNCEFTLHKSCFELPKKLQHDSHPNHPLTLHPTLPERDSMYFGCNACGEEPKSFVYECFKCDFSLHAKCATSWPETVTREDHQHSLAVQYKWPFSSDEYVNIFCEVCYGLCNDSNWLYYCGECKFGTHLKCATVKKEDGSYLENEEEKEEEEEEDYENMSDEQKLLMLTIKAQGQQARLNFQTQMAYMNAQTMANMFRHRYY